MLDMSDSDWDTGELLGEQLLWQTLTLEQMLGVLVDVLSPKRT